MTSECKVLGSGMAGLCAALTATEAGAIVLEKGKRGGPAALSAGLIWSLPDWARLREWIPALLQRLLASELEASWAWLERQDLPIGPTEVFRQHGRGRRMALGEPGRRGPFMEALRARAEATGARGGVLGPGRPRVTPAPPWAANWPSGRSPLRTGWRRATGSRW